MCGTFLVIPQQELYHIHFNPRFDTCSHWVVKICLGYWNQKAFGYAQLGTHDEIITQRQKILPGNFVWIVSLCGAWINTKKELIQRCDKNRRILASQ